MASEDHHPCVVLVDGDVTHTYSQVGFHKRRIEDADTARAIVERLAILATGAGCRVFGIDFCLQSLLHNWSVLVDGRCSFIRACFAGGGGNAANRSSARHEREIATGEMAGARLPRPISFAGDTATRGVFKCLSDAGAAVWLDRSTDVILDGNRTAAGKLVTRAKQTGPCVTRRADRRTAFQGVSQ